MNELDTATHRLLMTEAELTYNLHCFGDHLAAQEKYKVHKGLDAVRYYLMLKHGWLPAQVRNMSHEDLRLAMEEDMEGWTVPPTRRP